MSAKRKLKIELLEKQSEILRILVILLDHDEINYQKFSDVYGLYPTPFYLAIKKLLDLDLVSVRIDGSSYPNKKMASLTPKGKQVAEHLKAIEQIL